MTEKFNLFCTADMQNQRIVLGTALCLENFGNSVLVQAVGTQTVNSLCGNGYQFAIHNQIGSGRGSDGVSCRKQ